MVEINLQAGVIWLFGVAAVVLGITTGVALEALCSLKGRSSTSIAVGLSLGTISVLGWFLLLVEIFDRGNLIELRIDEGPAWGLGVLALAGGIAFGIAAGALSDDSEERDMAWGFGAFTVTSVLWFMLLVWLFNGERVLS